MEGHSDDNFRTPEYGSIQESERTPKEEIEIILETSATNEAGVTTRDSKEGIVGMSSAAASSPPPLRSTPLLSLSSLSCGHLYRTTNITLKENAEESCPYLSSFSSENNEVIDATHTHLPSSMHVPPRNPPLSAVEDLSLEPTAPGTSSMAPPSLSSMCLATKETKEGCTNNDGAPFSCGERNVGKENPMDVRASTVHPSSPLSPVSQGFTGEGRDLYDAMTLRPMSIAAWKQMIEDEKNRVLHGSPLPIAPPPLATSVDVHKEAEHPHGHPVSSSLTPEESGVTSLRVPQPQASLEHHDREPHTPAKRKLEHTPGTVWMNALPEMAKGTVEDVVCTPSSSLFPHAISLVVDTTNREEGSTFTEREACGEGEKERVEFAAGITVKEQTQEEERSPTRGAALEPFIQDGVATHHQDSMLSLKSIPSMHISPSPPPPFRPFTESMGTSSAAVPFPSLGMADTESSPLLASQTPPSMSLETVPTGTAKELVKVGERLSSLHSPQWEIGKESSKGMEKEEEKQGDTSVSSLAPDRHQATASAPLWPDTRSLVEENSAVRFHTLAAFPSYPSVSSVSPARRPSYRPSSPLSVAMKSLPMDSEIIAAADQYLKEEKARRKATEKKAVFHGLCPRRRDGSIVSAPFMSPLSRSEEELYTVETPFSVSFLYPAPLSFSCNSPPRSSTSSSSASGAMTVTSSPRKKEEDKQRKTVGSAALEKENGSEVKASTRAAERRKWKETTTGASPYFRDKKDNEGAEMKEKRKGVTWCPSVGTLESLMKDADAPMNMIPSIRSQLHAKTAEGAPPSHDDSSVKEEDGRGDHFTRLGSETFGPTTTTPSSSPTALVPFSSPATYASLTPLRSEDLLNTPPFPSSHTQSIVGVQLHEKRTKLVKKDIGSSRPNRDEEVSTPGAAWLGPCLSTPLPPPTTGKASYLMSSLCATPNTGSTYSAMTPHDLNSTTTPHAYHLPERDLNACPSPAPSTPTRKTNIFHGVEQEEAKTAAIDPAVLSSPPLALPVPTTLDRARASLETHSIPTVSWKDEKGCSEAALGGGTPPHLPPSFAEEKSSHAAGPSQQEQPVPAPPHVSLPPPAVTIVVSPSAPHSHDVTGCEKDRDITPRVPHGEGSVPSLSTSSLLPCWRSRGVTIRRSNKAKVIARITTTTTTSHANAMTLMSRNAHRSSSSESPAETSPPPASSPTSLSKLTSSPPPSSRHTTAPFPPASPSPTSSTAHAAVSPLWSNRSTLLFPAPVLLAVNASSPTIPDTSVEGMSPTVAVDPDSPPMPREKLSSNISASQPPPMNAPLSSSSPLCSSSPEENKENPSTAVVPSRGESSRTTAPNPIAVEKHLNAIPFVKSVHQDPPQREVNGFFPSPNSAMVVQTSATASFHSCPSTSTAAVAVGIQGTETGVITGTPAPPTTAESTRAAKKDGKKEEATSHYVMDTYQAFTLAAYRSLHQRHFHSHSEELEFLRSYFVASKRRSNILADYVKDLKKKLQEMAIAYDAQCEWVAHLRRLAKEEQTMLTSSAVVTDGGKSSLPPVAARLREAVLQTIGTAPPAPTRTTLQQMTKPQDSREDVQPHEKEDGPTDAVSHEDPLLSKGSITEDSSGSTRGATRKARWASSSLSSIAKEGSSALLSSPPSGIPKSAISSPLPPTSSLALYACTREGKKSTEKKGGGRAPASSATSCSTNTTGTMDRRPPPALRPWRQTPIFGKQRAESKFQHRGMGSTAVLTSGGMKEEANKEGNANPQEGNVIPSKHTFSFPTILTASKRMHSSTASPSDLQAMLQELRQNLARRDTDLETLRMEHHDLSHAHQTLERELRTTKQTLHSRTEERNLLQQECLAKEKEMEALEDIGKAARNEAVQLRSELQKVQERNELLELIQDPSVSASMKRKKRRELEKRQEEKRRGRSREWEKKKRKEQENTEEDDRGEGNKHHGRRPFGSSGNSGEKHGRGRNQRTRCRSSDSSSSEKKRDITEEDEDDLDDESYEGSLNHRHSRARRKDGRRPPSLPRLSYSTTQRQRRNDPDEDQEERDDTRTHRFRSSSFSSCSSSLSSRHRDGKRPLRSRSVGSLFMEINRMKKQLHEYRNRWWEAQDEIETLRQQNRSSAGLHSNTVLKKSSSGGELQIKHKKEEGNIIVSSSNTPATLTTTETEHTATVELSGHLSSSSSPSSTVVAQLQREIIYDKNEIRRLERQLERQLDTSHFREEQLRQEQLEAKRLNRLAIQELRDELERARRELQRVDDERQRAIGQLRGIVEDSRMKDVLQQQKDALQQRVKELSQELMECRGQEKEWKLSVQRELAEKMRLEQDKQQLEVYLQQKLNDLHFCEEEMKSLRKRVGEAEGKVVVLQERLSFLQQHPPVFTTTTSSSSLPHPPPEGVSPPLCLYATGLSDAVDEKKKKPKKEVETRKEELPAGPVANKENPRDAIHAIERWPSTAEASRRVATIRSVEPLGSHGNPDALASELKGYTALMAINCRQQQHLAALEEELMATTKALLRLQRQQEPPHQTSLFTSSEASPTSPGPDDKQEGGKETREKTPSGPATSSTYREGESSIATVDASPVWMSPALLQLRHGSLHHEILRLQDALEEHRQQQLVLQHQWERLRREHEEVTADNEVLALGAEKLMETLARWKEEKKRMKQHSTNHHKKTGSEKSKMAAHEKQASKETETRSHAYATPPSSAFLITGSDCSPCRAAITALACSHPSVTRHRIETARVQDQISTAVFPLPAPSGRKKVNEPPSDSIKARRSEGIETESKSKRKKEKTKNSPSKEKENKKANSRGIGTTSTGNERFLLQPPVLLTAATKKRKSEEINEKVEIEKESNAMGEVTTTTIATLVRTTTENGVISRDLKKKKRKEDVFPYSSVPASHSSHSPFAWPPPSHPYAPSTPSPILFPF